MKLLKASPQTKILTEGGDALDQGRRFAIFAQDLNGFILEATESAGEASETRSSEPGNRDVKGSSRIKER